MKAILEIRSGEGGEDSKLFIIDMLKMYQKYCEKNNIKIELVSQSDSEIILEISGKDLDNLIKYESGIHRIQRVSPTEKKNRRHSSTITVAILPIVEFYESKLEQKDIEYSTFRGQGPGGQHRNTTDTGIRVKHIPSGLVVSCCSGRSQHANKQMATKLLEGRLNALRSEGNHQKRASDRREQIGMFGREEKIRTYNLVENRVRDIRSIKTLYCADKILKGDLDKLYEHLK